MGVRPIGAGSISTTIPDGAVGPELFGGDAAVPQVSGDAADAPIPTNDWWSSLVFDYFNGPGSAPLYADPIALRADGAGLQIGYQSAVTYIDGPGLQVPDNLKYEYAFAPGLHVGVDGLGAAAVTVSDYGDWTVTANWQDGGAGLRATFGHGLPFVFFSRTGAGAVVVDVMAAPPTSHVDNPTQPLVYRMDGLTGTFDGGITRFTLPVDAGAEVGDGPQVRISYDLDGNGRFDRVETYHYRATDAAPGWESYSEASGLSSQTGNMADIVNGSVKLEIWNAIGVGTPQVRVDAPAGDPHQAILTLPFDDLRTADGEAVGTLYLRDGASVDTPSVLSTTPGSSAGVDVIGSGGEELDWDGQGEIWHSAGGVLGLTVRGVDYGLFAPQDASWIVTDTGLRSDLGGANGFAAAVLPEKSVAVLEFFAGRADDVPTGSTADFTYDVSNATVTQAFSVATATGEDPLSALYRHQWINTDEPLAGYSYASPRGEMALARDARFAVTYDANPMLPVLPLLDGAAKDQVRALVLADVAELAGRPIKVPFQDTYTVGKELGRLADLAQIANQVGETAARDTYLGAIKAELQDWFTAGGKQFVYNDAWGTLQGYPASFDTEKQLNDHNFHYGYFIQAAATIGMFDRGWIAQDQWGGVVDLLVADVANAERNDSQFPWLRSFDPYAGHSWASGHGDFHAGNNNESSTEALNFDAAVALWGAVTGRDDVRDLGIGLHAVESAAVLQYWFDVDDAVFPDGFPYQSVGMIWGDGASHSTWFSDNPEMIHGINVMPVGAANSLYLATHQDEILANYAEMAAESGGAPRYWKNILWNYLGLANPDQALHHLQADSDYSLNEGGSGSRAQTLHWISSLSTLGTLNPGVRADTPFHAVFTRNGIDTYVAYNPGEQDLLVRFTDGTVLAVEPGVLATLRDGTTVVFGIGSTSAPGPAPDPGPDPDPIPVPTPIPDPVPGPVSHGAGLRMVDGRIDFGEGLGTITLASAGGANHDGVRQAASSFGLGGVTAQFVAGQASGFDLKVDAGTGVGDAVQASISYDFTGDGSDDRVETWRYFATNDTLGWEAYGSQGSLQSVTGVAMQDLAGGSVTVALWTALGTHPVLVDVDASSLSLPFRAGDTTPVPDPVPLPDPLPSPDPLPPPTAGDGLELVNGSVRFGAGSGIVTLASSNAANHDGTPHAAASFTLENLAARYFSGETTGFRLPVDAGAQVGDAAQAGISYDFDGDGTFDRSEIWHYFATDDALGWQVYGETAGLQSVSGAPLRDLVGGTVKLDLWTAIGAHSVAVDLAASSLDLPFEFGTPQPAPPPSPGSAGPGDGSLVPVSTGSSGLQFSIPSESVIASAGGGRYIDQPRDAVVLTAEGLHGTYDGGGFAFALSLDAGAAMGNGTQLRVSFDFDGNGAVDRSETFQYFATNDVAGWETYSHSVGLNAASGSYSDFSGGGVTVEIWNAIGTSPVMLDDGASLILPFQDLTI